MDEIRIAVVGAGIAGLACAREIARADVAVTVFERARGLGGVSAAALRASTSEPRSIMVDSAVIER